MSGGIGTLRERSLHAALKDWYKQPGDELEIKVDGYVIDVVRSDLLIEIQTGNFAALKKKLYKLTTDHVVRLVHPITVRKWLVKYGADGETLIERRKSPQNGNVYDIFKQLVSFPGLMKRENFTLEVLLVETEEIRINDGAGSWRRQGWSIADRKLLEVSDRVLFDTPSSFLPLLPDTLGSEFTVKELAHKAGIRQRLAGRMAYCLREMNVITVIGKQGNAYLYKTGVTQLNVL